VPPAVSRPRRPAATVLHGTVREHLEGFESKPEVIAREARVKI